MNRDLAQSAALHQPVRRKAAVRWRGWARIRKTLIGFIFPAAILLIWEYLGRKGAISPLLFPIPSRIFQVFVTMLKSGVLWDNMQMSLWRAAAGFLVGGSLGLTAGLLVGFLRKVERAVDPTIQMIRMVPHLAVTSLFVLWFGIGEASKILLIAKGAFFPLYINTYLGIRNVDNKLFEVSRVLGFSRSKQIMQVIIPGALPSIFTGIRFSIAVSWLGLVVAEIMGSSTGIGYLMMDARAMSKTSVVFVGIFIFTVFGKLTDSFIVWLEGRCMKWKDSFEGTG